MPGPARRFRHAGSVAWALIGTLAAAMIVRSLATGAVLNSVWVVCVAACVYAIAYRHYSAFLARKVLRVDRTRPTPAVRIDDGMDYVPTDKRVLFGHHFAAIAGAGPLVGPVLAAQLGYFPGVLWILAGVVFAGAVQDFMVLFISTRRDGRSLGEIVSIEVGPVAGLAVMLGTWMIMTIILAVLALIVVRALVASPWGFFTIAATIPLAIAMGIYGRWLRPGRVAEMSALGIVGLLAALVMGRHVAASPWLSGCFSLSAVTLCGLLAAYGAAASRLPVWLLLAPRDYLSTFLKLSAIAALAVGILLVHPALMMPPVTRFIAGDGPVWNGPVFPFLFITIACGAVSGFHALIASGTTPKMIASEEDARAIGYGGMIAESAVAIMALVAASMLEPGVYFAMNSPAAIVGSSAQSAATAVSAMGFPLDAGQLQDLTRSVGEQTLVARTGGAPTLAIAMAGLFSRAFGDPGQMGFWYHFAILFEALFILTAVDAGTRAARFMFQDLVGRLFRRPAWAGSRWLGDTSTLACVSAWGAILYMGVTDPMGGVNSLWPLFGIANQMLAAIALMLCTVVLFKMKRDRHAWVAAVPCLALVATTLTAAAYKVASTDPRLGFFAHAMKFADALQAGRVVWPARTLQEMSKLVRNDIIDGSLCIAFTGVLCTCFVFCALAIRRARARSHPTAIESPGGQAGDAA